MRRYWVKRESTGQSALSFYFGSEGEAEEIAELLTEESEDDEFYVSH